MRILSHELNILDLHFRDSKYDIVINSGLLFIRIDNFIGIKICGIAGKTDYNEKCYL